MHDIEVNVIPVKLGFHAFQARLRKSSFATGQTKCLLRPGIVAVIILGALVGLPFRSNDRNSLYKRAGNPDVANDVYGIGVRMGIYLQALGMLISSLRLRVGGIKIACAANMIGILSSWTYIARHHEFSGPEAFLIVTLVASVSTPAMVVASVPDPESILANVLLLAANLWTLAISFWFWGTLYAQLPSLGTSNAAWFFTRVSIRDWFRIFMLVSMALDTAIFLVSVAFTTIATRKSLEYIAQHGVTEQQLEELVKEIQNKVISASSFAAVILVLTIASVEMIIKYNDLRPTNTLTTPGQIIPLAIGATVLVDGCVNLAFE